MESMDLGFSAGQPAPRPVHLHVVHDFGGGIGRWLDDFCLADRARVNLVLKPYSLSHAYAEGLVLHEGNAPERLLRIVRFSSPIHATDVHHAEYRQAVEAILRDFQVGAILVSSFIGHALDILATGLPTLVINHDFYPVCPAINLYFGQVCTSCDAARLSECASRNTDFNSPHRIFPVAQRLKLREGLCEMLLAQRTTMVVPTDSVRRHLLDIVPDLAALRFETIPHGQSPLLAPVSWKARDASARLRVLVLGIQSVTKGMRLLFEILPELTRFADVYLVGAREAGELFRYREAVHVVDEYRMEELQGIVEGIAPDLGLLLSPWPETFSYTLGELLQLRIVPVATRVGGFADRIQDGETGFLVAPEAPSVLACLRRLDLHRDVLEHVRSNLARLPPRSPAEMVAAYHDLLPLSGGPSALPESDVAAAEAALLSGALRSWKLARSQGVRLDMKEGRLREIHEALLRARSECEGLRADLHAGEARIEALHSSTSWRVSAPLRWLARRVRAALGK